MGGYILNRERCCGMKGGPRERKTWRIVEGLGGIHRLMLTGADP